MMVVLLSCIIMDNLRHRRLQQETLEQSNGNVNVGVYDWPTPKLYYEGNIDDIYFYNYALTDSEVEGLYTQGGWPVAPSFASSSMLSSTIVQGDITIYPNPVLDYLEVVHADINVPVTDISVVVYDDDSGTIQNSISYAESSINHGLQVNMTSLVPGFYFLHVNDKVTVEVIRIQKE